VARDYLTVADVLGMHAALMRRYGGAPGVRDPGALEAALFRPQTGYYDDLGSPLNRTKRVQSWGGLSPRWQRLPEVFG
jgi:hypothetical protein